MMMMIIQLIYKSIIHSEHQMKKHEMVKSGTKRSTPEARQTKQVIYGYCFLFQMMTLLSKRRECQRWTSCWEKTLK